ncbi:MAG: mannose-1-phosphate guanylyltransferase, partial [Balneolaceae bacterium]|nr:mannose-1-phosphate guanylyltransferase [Balneolaceae bacterium]
MLHAVIMAGGTGSRFWPKSTRKRPKQFLDLFGDRTMLQATVQRIESLVPPERIWIITNEQYVDLVAKQLPEVPGSNIVGEPVAKNTAPCVALAAGLLERKDPDATMVVLPADHTIEEVDAFLEILETAAAKAKNEETLVTIGIKPSRPETGYGYIEFVENASETVNGRPVYRVAQFREKPDLETARQFVDSGNFLWNSGMFIWSNRTILKQFEQHLPEIHEQIQQLPEEPEEDGWESSIEAFYNACPSISIDYGIMEKAGSVHVVPGAFGWNDVGSWKAVYELMPKDASGNVVRAAYALGESSENNLIQVEGKKMVALVGVENLAVVETEDAILICNLDHAQEVKQIVNRLHEKEELKK